MKWVYVIVAMLVFLPIADAEPEFIFKLSQGIEGARAFLIFSKGDQQTIANRMPLITAGKFLRYISPSFAFGLGVTHPLKLLAHYDNIDIEGFLLLERGYHRIIIENNGTVSGRPQIIIRQE